MKVYFIFPYPVGKAASQRFRFEQYLTLLKENHIEFTLSPFLSDKGWNVLYQPGRFLVKVWSLASGFIRRVRDLFRIISYDVVFVHRESAPIGPPIFEFFACKILGKKLIFDFDDAIWIRNASESNRMFSALKAHNNVFTICRWANKVSVGNTYLKNTIASYNSNVVVNPTTIDTENWHNRTSDHKSEKTIVGWTGSHSTIKYLDLIFPVIRDLKNEFDFEFKVISDVPPSSNEDLWNFVKWSKEREIDDLLSLNVGIMPLTHDPWSEGKCGFKALQYMSLGIPSVVSPVGVNTEIVTHGVNGFVCSDLDQWSESLAELINDRGKVIGFGQEARKSIEKKYSVNSNGSNFLHLLTDFDH